MDLLEEQKIEQPNDKVETEPVCVNKDRPVYFSYARNDSKNPDWQHISDCVEKLLETFRKENIEYKIDVADLGAGNRISDFEKEIGFKSEIVVLVFSDKYFRSMHCMYEFVQIKKSLAAYPDKKLLCIKSGQFSLSDIDYIMQLEQYWGDKKQECESIEYHRLRSLSETERSAKDNGFYMDDVRDLYSFFSAINYTTSDINDWSCFTNEIKKYYANKPKPNLPDPIQNLYNHPQQQQRGVQQQPESGVQQQAERVVQQQAMKQPVQPPVMRPQPTATPRVNNAVSYSAPQTQQVKKVFLSTIPLKYKIIGGIVLFISLLNTCGACLDDTQSETKQYKQEYYDNYSDYDDEQENVNINQTRRYEDYNFDDGY